MSRKKHKTGGVLIVRQDPSDPDLYRDQAGREYSEGELDELQGFTIFKVVNKLPQMKKDIQRVKGYKSA